MNDIKLIAFDLDGTLTQHRSPLDPEHRAMLEALAEKYRLLMVGAGACMRIFDQMERFPIDIIGNYGLQYGKYDPQTGDLDIVRSDTLPCDRESVSARVAALRERYGFTRFTGDSVEFHASGAVTLPVLGTKAALSDKLAFDPDRSRRRAIYGEVCAAFPEYNVFIGGSSSFDMTPRPYDKLWALDRYCRDEGLAHAQAVYCGDDYGPGGNDEPLYRSDFRFICVDDYRQTPALLAEFLK